MNESTYKILMIDDDEGFKKLLQIRLKTFMDKMEVVCFSNLDTAREFLSEAKKLDQLDFDLVALDQHLPDGQGIDLLNEGWFEDIAVLSISSDTDPETPGHLVGAGAAYFVSKMSISEPLFKPLVLGVIDRNRARRELSANKVKLAVFEHQKTLLNTLRHEINNPLGAVLGAAYLIRANKKSTDEQKQAAEMVESSGKRIKHVLDQLSDAKLLDPVFKADQEVFQVPGDKDWGEKRKAKK